MPLTDSHDILRAGKKNPIIFSSPRGFHDRPVTYVGGPICEASRRNTEKSKSKRGEKQKELSSEASHPDQAWLDCVFFCHSSCLGDASQTALTFHNFQPSI